MATVETLHELSTSPDADEPDPDAYEPFDAYLAGEFEQRMNEFGTLLDTLDADDHASKLARAYQIVIDLEKGLTEFLSADLSIAQYSYCNDLIMLTKYHQGCVLVNLNSLQALSLFEEYYHEFIDNENISVGKECWCREVIDCCNKYALLCIELHDFEKAAELLNTADNVYCSLKKRFVIEPAQRNYRRSKLSRAQRHSAVIPRSKDERARADTRRTADRQLELSKVVCGDAPRSMVGPTKGIARFVNSSIAVTRARSGLLRCKEPSKEDVSQLIAAHSGLQTAPATALTPAPVPCREYPCGLLKRSTTTGSFVRLAAEDERPPPVPPPSGACTHGASDDTGVGFVNVLRERNVDDSDPRPRRITMLDKPQSGRFPNVRISVGVAHHVELLHVDTFFYRAEMNRIVKELQQRLPPLRRNKSFSSSADFVFFQ